MPKSLLLLGLSLVAVAMVYIQGQIRADLRHDVAWMRYGAPSSLRQQANHWFPLTYPLLLHWSEGNNVTRQSYALTTILEQGQPYAHWWLTDQLKRNPSASRLINLLGVEGWQKQFGLDTPLARKEAIQLALTQINDQDGYQQFNVRFLADLNAEAWEAVLQALPRHSAKQAEALLTVFPYAGAGMPELLAQQVTHLQTAHTTYHDWPAEITNLPNAKAAFELYHNVTAGEQKYLLESITNQEQYPVNGQLLVLRILGDDHDPLQILAAAVLLTKHDKRGRALLATALNGDFIALKPITNRLILLQLAENFPNSRFTQACRAYGAIRGGSYFGGYRNFENTTAKKSTAARMEELKWRTWLTQYPNHPGADDAGYWLGRTLMWQGKRIAALKQFADLVAMPVPDGDMKFRLLHQLLWLLDVGTSEAELQEFYQQFALHPLAPAAQYAQALRQARQQNYPEALRLTRGLTIDPVLNLFQRPYGNQTISRRYGVQQELWQNLARDPSPRLAALARSSGYQLGYLVLFDDGRAGGIGTDDDLLPSLKDNYRQANALAVALSLTWPLLQKPEFAEKTRFQQINLLYRLYQSYPDGEISAMHPLPTFDPQIGHDPTLYQPTKAERQNQFGGWEVWYIRQVAHAVQALRQAFPNSVYNDDALMTLYEMTARSAYLTQLLRDYPQGDRVEEAKAALYMVEHPQQTLLN